MRSLRSHTPSAAERRAFINGANRMIRAAGSAEHIDLADMRGDGFRYDMVAHRVDTDYGTATIDVMYDKVVITFDDPKRAQPFTDPEGEWRGIPKSRAFFYYDGGEPCHALANLESRLIPIIRRGPEAAANVLSAIVADQRKAAEWAAHFAAILAATEGLAAAEGA